jgi:hypothetical protein
MLDREYDFILNVTTQQMFYRESKHLGGLFAPITDSSRYLPAVRDTYRKVKAEMLKAMA